jgi:hypothetical protein
MNRVTLVLVIITALLQGAAAQTITGVVKSDGHPLSGATVRIQGLDQPVTTDDKGHFSLVAKGSNRHDLFITAAHEGYYNNRVRVHGHNLVIELEPLPAQDNSLYRMQDPAPDKAKADNCGNCHSSVYAQWKIDAHANSATDPLVTTLYDGTDIHGNRDRGPGYKRDWTDEGNCAMCHAPIAAIERQQAVSLSEVRGVEAAGVTCDVCHKMREVPTAFGPPNLTDVHFLRPAQGGRLNFGPFDDSTFPNEVPDFSYSPLFKDSKLCAPCHDGKSWGVPIYETYSEWKAGPYSKVGIQCQDCHMHSTGEYDRFADEDKGGKVRSVTRIGFHQTLGKDRSDFLRSAVRMESTATANDDLLTVKVRVMNVGAGHDLPTGQPMRNMLLLVSAEDDSGSHLTFVAGDRIPAWGGAGPDPNDYAGQAGKGFAKVLETLNEYQKPTIIAGDRENAAEFPAPAWRRSKILSDNRIPPKGADTSTYLFLIPQNSKHLHVKTQLIYRKAFKPLADVKGWDIPDVTLASIDVTVGAH